MHNRAKRLMDLDAIHLTREAAEDLAEEYLLGHLSRADHRIYEEHLLVCERCRRAVAEVDEFIRMLRRAAGKDESPNPSRCN